MIRPCDVGHLIPGLATPLTDQYRRAVAYIREVLWAGLCDLEAYQGIDSPLAHVDADVVNLW
jgi:hypothetical protein